MARQVRVHMVDDLDGEQPAEETVQFSLDGVRYEIDLSSSNADRLRSQLAEWVKAARRRRRVGGDFAVSGPSFRPYTPIHRGEGAAIRAWASDNGYQIAERGRIPADIVDAFREATSKSA
ncbi:histone-like nucleoid-structuring protein Lsr2 [Mycolicibacterium palauense]|uniref:histone-like nucleoid-structuring protein Lsr2 n=1 Tax=Mycolicibacterium palauense TaxID=2034511 RepID=UPI000BFF183A|nr:Lsr2 family protein [Mycolicibacterium palauense]